MRFQALAGAVVLSLSATGIALGCQSGPVVDLDGNIVPPPTLGQNIAESRVAFVGTVIGFRNDATELVAQSIDCWHDTTYSGDQCHVFLSTITSVVFSVDHAIKGIEPGRLYEEYYSTGDGDCGPDLKFGKHYIRTDQIFGVEELAGEPTEEQLAHRRAAAAGT